MGQPEFRVAHTCGWVHACFACHAKLHANWCKYTSVHAKFSNMQTRIVLWDTQAGWMMSCILLFALCFEKLQINNHVTWVQPRKFMGCTPKTAVQLLPTQIKLLKPWLIDDIITKLFLKTWDIWKGGCSLGHWENGFSEAHTPYQLEKYFRRGYRQNMPVSHWMRIKTTCWTAIVAPHWSGTKPS